MLHGASSLSEDDKQFAACLAAPPDIMDEKPLGSMSMQNRLVRMASMVSVCLFTGETSETLSAAH